MNEVNINIDAQEIINRYRAIVSEQLNAIIILEAQLQACANRITELEGAE